MGRNHVRVCRELNVLAGVCDPNAGALSKIEEQYRCPTFLSLDDALDSLDASDSLGALNSKVSTWECTNSLNSDSVTSVTKQSKDSQEKKVLKRTSGSPLTCAIVSTPTKTHYWLRSGH
jgi:hypothetical protein